MAKTNNPYHFPELRIPRTTALHWIKNSRNLKLAGDSHAESERIKKLQAQIDQQQALLNLARRVRDIFRHGFHSGKPIFGRQRK